MTVTVKVRLIPRTTDGISLASMNFAFRGANQPRISVIDKKRSTEAFKIANNMAIPAVQTPKHAIDAELEVGKVEDLFGVKLVEKTVRNTKETYFSPDLELKVPEALQNTIAFAYLPTPPENFNISYLPPRIALYNLGLSDVLLALNGARAHRRGWTGKNVKIAMPDTGFANHPYFDKNQYAISRISTASTIMPTIDDIGHGTGESANALIFAPDCQFIGVKHNDQMASALELAISQNPQIITNSWGWDCDTVDKNQLQAKDPNFYNELIDIEQIVLDAISDGIVMVFSAGNGQLAFPASIPDVIAVGGVTVWEDSSLEASNYASSFLSKLYPNRSVPDICGVVGSNSAAPMKGHIMLPVPKGCKLDGENMPTSQKNKGWGVFSGTSAAAPQVAGIVAMMLSVNPSLKPSDIKSILINCCIDITKGQSIQGAKAKVGPDLATGAGLIDAYRACKEAEQRL